MDQRKAIILKSCRTPKTYEELSEELDTGYFAVRNLVQELIDAKVLEETPFNRRGTRQKQFRTRAFNQDTLFTRDTCAIFNFLGEDHTALQLLNSHENEDAIKTAVTILFTCLSAPMTEVIKDANMVGAPHSSVVETKLLAVQHVLEELLSLTEQLIHSGVWGDAEAAKILFDKPVENTNTEIIFEAKARLFAIATERGW